MARPATRRRTIHITDDDWAAALAAADERGEILGEEIRAFVVRYGKPARRTARKVA